MGIDLCHWATFKQTRPCYGRMASSVAESVNKGYNRLRYKPIHQFLIGHVEQESKRHVKHHQEATNHQSLGPKQKHATPKALANLEAVLKKVRRTIDYLGLCWRWMDN